MPHKKISWVILSFLLLFVISIACKQSGEILTPVEATQRYEATQAAASGDVTGDAEGAEFSEGAKAILTGQAYLIGLFTNPGDPVSYSFATRGDEVTVLGSLSYEGEIWYKIETLAGSGWLLVENLVPAE